jgi:hypothetical protein
LEAYAKLQNIQNYVSLSTTSFRNSCAFGLDTILGKMMSKAEQDIDYEFVKRSNLPWRKEMSSDPVTQAHAQR